MRQQQAAGKREKMANEYSHSDTAGGYPIGSEHHHERSRARAMSGEHSRRYMAATQPAAINETIQQNLATGDLPPEVLDEIANRVFQQLKSTHLDMHTPPMSSHPPPPPYHQPSVSSPSSYSASSPPPVGRNVYTPPSPHRSDDQYYGSPTRPSEHTSNVPATEKRTESPTLSQTSETSHAQTRPKPPTRDSTGREETILEKIWGELFDVNGAPTPRLGQFLRGVAVHLIEDYEPANSLVITPQKMQKFYADTKLSKEFYEWQDVFDDNTSSISRMYREIEAQHHLVQETFDQRPDIPGLTPQGFERWATLLILAHPESEYERLQKAVLDMPISNPDDKKERFPKELSRRLFPKTPDFATRARIEKAMAVHCGISIPTPPVTDRYASPRRTSPPHTTPPQTRSETLHSTTSSAPIERERQPYSNNPSEAAASDDEGPVTKPIERERQPYSAQPGQGRMYDDATPRPTPSAQSSQPQPPPPINTNRSRTRAESVTSRARPMSINLGSQRPNLNLGTGDYSQDPNLPPFSRPTGTPITTTAAPQRGTRRHSPSFSNNNLSASSSFAQGDFRRSEGDIFSPGSYPASGSHFQPPPPMSSSAYGSIPGSRGGNIPPTSAADEEYYRGRMGSGSINAGGVGYEYGANPGQGYSSSGGYR